MESVLSTKALDTSLLDSVSVITSADSDMSSLKYCGCLIDSKRSPANSSKKRQKSLAFILQHSQKCPLLSVKRARVEERYKIRGILTRFFTEMESSFGEVMQYMEAKESHLKLLDTLDQLNKEKNRLESKIHYMKVSRMIRLSATTPHLKLSRLR